MHKNFGFLLAFGVLTVGLVIGCKRENPAGAGDAYFKTPFQNEAQFVIHAVISDLAEQMSYAASRQFPDPKSAFVTVNEKPRPSAEAPVFEVQVSLGRKASTRFELKIDRPIWDALVYETAAEELARAAGVSPAKVERTDSPQLIAKLLDASPETLERENQVVSAALEKDFRDPELHERAALLLGAFMLRERSGFFFEIRAPLSRLTTHLAMARFLRGAGPHGLNGEMAEAIMLTLIGNQRPALERLEQINGDNPAVAAMVRALKARNTSDPRFLDGIKEPTPMEAIEWLCAMANSVAWQKLNENQKQTLDFIRTASQSDYSVEIGHELLNSSLRFELQEINAVCQLSREETLTSNGGVVKVLNASPERCFSKRPSGKPCVRVIGWGQWAMFLQRHLCHAVKQGFYFMNSKWGVHDEAKEFAARCDREFGELRLYPFVRRFNCTDAKSYRQAVDEGLAVTVSTPHLVPAYGWDILCNPVRFAPLYAPVRNTHLNEWHKHNPLPETVYDLGPRLTQPSLIHRRDALARFEKLNKLAPYDGRIINFIFKLKYNDKPTYEQAMALCEPVLAFNSLALQRVAQTVQDKPELYEKLMLQGAALSPVAYYGLWRQANTRKQEDKAAQYLDQAFSADPDRVRASNNAEWLVRYYLKKDRVAQAGQIAEAAGGTYSKGGMHAQAVFFEATRKYEDAFEWFAKIEERYNDSAPVLNFCARYGRQTGEPRFEPEVKKRLPKLFPKGLEKVSLGDFQGPPADGVLIKEQNEIVRSAGLKAGDVIVAVYGVRVHHFQQYQFARETKSTPQMELIVWQGDGYREFKPSPPDHLFGVEMANYPPERPTR